jgi:hypothetical protein
LRFLSANAANISSDQFMWFEHLPDQLTAKLVAELDWFLSWTILSWIIRTWVWSEVPVIEDCSLSDVSKSDFIVYGHNIPVKTTLFSILIEILNIFEIPF